MRVALLTNGGRSAKIQKLVGCIKGAGARLIK